METKYQYPLFRKDFNREYYLLHVEDFKLRKSLGMLKLGSDRLAIESGHHRKPQTPVEDCTCNYYET